MPSVKITEGAVLRDKSSGEVTARYVPGYIPLCKISHASVPQYRLFGKKLDGAENGEDCREAREF